MADNWMHDAARRTKAAALVGPTMPNPGRVGDHLTGGRDNFEVDRRASRSLIAASPVPAAIVPAARALSPPGGALPGGGGGNQAIPRRPTRLTMSGNTHEIAQSLAPDCRIVYASSDPVVLSHARALAMSTNAGVVAALDAVPVGSHIALYHQASDWTRR
jgi:hypothetical protein